MKEKKTIIMIRVKAPTILHPERIDGIETALWKLIGEPFKCEKQIHYAPDEGNAKTVTFYIFRKGLLKNSVRCRLEKNLEYLKHRWFAMIGYTVVAADTEED